MKKQELFFKKWKSSYFKLCKCARTLFNPPTLPERTGGVKEHQHMILFAFFCSVQVCLSLHVCTSTVLLFLKFLCCILGHLWFCALWTCRLWSAVCADNVQLRRRQQTRSQSLCGVEIMQKRIMTQRDRNFVTVPSSHDSGAQLRARTL